jgi:hypothetical protein
LKLALKASEGFKSADLSRNAQRRGPRVGSGDSQARLPSARATLLGGQQGWRAPESLLRLAEVPDSLLQSLHAVEPQLGSGIVEPAILLGEG